MDTTTLIWIIVGIVVIAAVVIGVVAFTARGRSDRRVQAQHAQAEDLRRQARESELAAREKEAEVAQTRADAATAAALAEQSRARAAQAEADAERASGALAEHEHEAERLRAEQAETLQKAHDMDPYATGDADTPPLTRPRPEDATDHDDAVRDETRASGAERRADAPEHTTDADAEREAEPVAADDTRRARAERA